MKKQKLSLNDFEAVDTVELLKTKGGYRPHVNHSRHAILAEGDGGGGGGGCSGGKKGDSNGFGGTFDADEVVVTGDFPACLACSDRDSPRPVWQKGLGTLIRDLFMHRDGCPNSL